MAKVQHVFRVGKDNVANVGYQNWLRGEQIVDVTEDTRGWIVIHLSNGREVTVPSMVLVHNNAN